jgi:acyl carrier protein
MTSPVYERFKRIIVDQLGVDDEDVTKDAYFAEDLNVDYGEILDLVMTLEEEFGIEISPADVTRYFIRQDATVGRALEYLEECLE